MKVEPFQIMHNDRVTVVKPSAHLALRIWQTIQKESCNELLPFLPKVDLKPSLTQIEDALHQMSCEWQDNTERFTLVIWDNVRDEWTGCIRLAQQYDTEERIQLDCWIRPSFAGNGVARLALLLIQQELHHQRPESSLELRCKETDLINRGLALTCGFHYQSTLKRAATLPSGLLDNVVIYARKALNEATAVCQLA